MKKAFLYHANLIVLLLFITVNSLFAAESKAVLPGLKDRCPVCGMFVVKYPDFIAEIIFRDGSYAVFDGAKDMFKYYFNLKKYDPGKKKADIDTIYVSDYYSLHFIDGQKAYYVLGSDVYGPMGRELIPFQKLSDAKEFKKDHKGKSILTFSEITDKIIKGID